MADAGETLDGPGELRARYGAVHPLALDKVLDRFDRHARAFIELSPFLVLGTADADGKQDVSPRGDPPGFVRVLDDRTLAIPDRPGNRRVDSLGNVLANPEVGLLFFVPGVNETLRVNGRARVSTEPDLMDRLAVAGRPALSALVIEVREVFFHCGKALIRSRLWDDGARIERARFPSLGRILADQVAGVEARQAEREVEESYRTRLY
jgi:PPOX class probable FMN-dependent enzyme